MRVYTHKSQLLFLLQVSISSSYILYVYNFTLKHSFRLKQLDLSGIKFGCNSENICSGGL